MRIAVRYFSRSGRTAAVAEAIAEGAGAKASSIGEEPRLTEYTDLLFLGGAPYANVMDKALRAYAEMLVPEQVGAVALLSTSNWSHRTLRGLREILEKKGISVVEEECCINALQVQKKLPDAKAFARRIKAACEISDGG